MWSIIGWLLGSLAALIVWRHVEPHGILFYQGIAVGAAAFILHILFWRRWKDATIFFLAFYAFVLTVPTTVDRSYSVRMIDEIAASKDGVSKKDVTAMFQGYFERGGGVDRRIAEQLATGSIKVDHGRIRATPIGKLLAASFRLTAFIFASDISE
jgi:hypothetical protein